MLHFLGHPVICFRFQLLWQTVKAKKTYGAPDHSFEYYVDVKQKLSVFLDVDPVLIFVSATSYLLSLPGNACHWHPILSLS